MDTDNTTTQSAAEPTTTPTTTPTVAQEHILSPPPDGICGKSEEETIRKGITTKNKRFPLQFLALVPRGLQHVISEIIQNSVTTGADINNGTISRHRQRTNDDRQQTNSDTSTKVLFPFRIEHPDSVESCAVTCQAQAILQQQEVRQEERRKRKELATAVHNQQKRQQLQHQPQTTRPTKPTDPKQSDKQLRVPGRKIPAKEWCQQPVGTAALSQTEHISVGYFTARTTTTPSTTTTTTPSTTATITAGTMIRTPSTADASFDTTAGIDTPNSAIDPSGAVQSPTADAPGERPSAARTTTTWTCPGQLSGSVWLQIQVPTRKNRSGGESSSTGDDPTDIGECSDSALSVARSISKLRCIGPLMSLICVASPPSPPSSIAAHQSTTEPKRTTGIDLTAPDRTGWTGQGQGQSTIRSQDKMTRQIIHWLRSNRNEYRRQFEQAYRVWKYHVETVWKGQLSRTDYDGLQQRIESNQLHYRLSCSRSNDEDEENNRGRHHQKRRNRQHNRCAKLSSATTTSPSETAVPSTTTKNNTTTASTASCISASNYSSPLPSSRQELLRCVMEECGSILVPHMIPKSKRQPGQGQQLTGGGSDYSAAGTAGASDGANHGSGWKVNLNNYDLEIVIVISPSSDTADIAQVKQQTNDDSPAKSQQLSRLSVKKSTFAIGISMCPYSFFKSKSFSCGVVPTDITSPYIGASLLSGLVRLRPTTAHVLLHLANVQPYDVVLDPCAGIGTIPVEADQYFFLDNEKKEDSDGKKQQQQQQQQQQMLPKSIGLGGDLVVHHPSMSIAAAALEGQRNRKHHHRNGEVDDAPTSTNGFQNVRGSSLLAAWDAAHLPIRTRSVDAIVSDLPFGKQCLSAHALSQLLPLVMRQCARILIPSSGRMVLLCGGSPASIFTALQESQEYWVQPCTIVAPVTIGGLQAWILRIERSGLEFDDSIANNPTNQRMLERTRKLAKRRDRIAGLDRNKQGNTVLKQQQNQQQQQQIQHQEIQQQVTTTDEQNLTVNAGESPKTRKRRIQS